MKQRTGKIATLKFNYKKGVDDFKYLEKLAVSLKNIRLTKTILLSEFNNKIKSTIIPGYSYAIIPVGFLISLLGMIFVKPPYNLLLLITGIVLWMFFFIFIWAKSRKLDFLLKRTKRAIHTKTLGALRLEVEKDYCLILSENKIRLFPKILNLIIKINKNGELHSFVIKVLDKNSNIIRKSNSKTSLTDYQTNDVNLQEFNSVIQSDNEFKQGNSIKSSIKTLSLIHI